MSNVGLFKQTAGKHPVSQFFPDNMIFLEEQSLWCNKICMVFNPRGGAREPLSAPRLRGHRAWSTVVCHVHVIS